ncbi:hypothetical protein OG978_44050 (plasmid) [Streptomyces sp. NBC_01591]|uniref:hypothetical protein n=1 Tax=Streptomyces sp. NBC_01591 TaxID=2975888 RepID=UPI002DDC2B3A|nr:hypothetical protein [Streptomyces sp. NBC_01591]WSD74112.1 hypothetical protein OG978_44050 [Streptomyces sp. NBC_01591]
MLAERDVLTDMDATVLFQAFYAGSVSPHDRVPPEWAAALAGLTEAGLLVLTEADAAVLADDAQYGLRVIQADETSAY